MGRFESLRVMLRVKMNTQAVDALHPRVCVGTSEVVAIKHFQLQGYLAHKNPPPP